ncbi:hypothetical protein HYX14_05675 [Candidatus Woesearchaeota archaeon]|nr:hypothetical protein [Candidatus Woesearchaeota archaeon]
MKKAMVMFVLLVLLSSFFVLAQEETQTKECSFWCKVGKFFFGSSEARAGKGWFERGAAGK